MISVLLCEDSLPVSRLLVEIINTDQDLKVVGVCGNGREALELCRRLKPQVIAMDARMPVLNGLEATRIIMAENPTPIVMVSELAETDMTLSMQALEAGALVVLPKPHGPGHSDFRTESERFCQTLKTMSSVKLVRRWLPGSTGPLVPVFPDKNIQSTVVRPRLVAVGASTGGPSALATILRGLPSSFDLPVLVTQHIMAGFGVGLAKWLNETTGRPVITARNGMKLEEHSGLTILAPDDCHLTITPNWQLKFDYRGPVNGVWPSVDVMFDSVAGSFGAAAIGVLLTGMGRDGAAGLKRMRQSGSVTIVQDESTSVVFGMPKEAIDLGAACQVLPLEKIPGQLVTLF